jgi:predicted DsbA family dithiol-disulfide isomerase
VRVEWRAYQLHPDDAPPVPPETETVYRKRIAEGWPRVQEIARATFGLDLQRMEGEGGHRSTRLAHVGAKVARHHGQAEAYHQAVFRAHWQELRDISAPDTLVAIARGLGIDEVTFRAGLASSDFQAEVEADLYWAWQQGLTGVPAFIFAMKYLVQGAQPPQVLEQVVDRCLEEGLGEADADPEGLGG